MTNATLPFDRPARRPSTHPTVALVAIGSAFSSLFRSLEGWLSAAAAKSPTTPEELIAMADRLEESQPSYAADLRAAALRAQDLH